MKDQERKRKIKELATVIGGTGLGAATGYTAMQALKKSRYGKALKEMPGSKRLEYLVPAGTALGAGMLAANYMKNKKRKELKKIASISVSEWVYYSLMGK